MLETRSAVPSDVHPYQMSDDEYYWVGRLIRATASLDDIVKDYLSALLQIEPGAMVLLLGRMAVSARIGIAKTAAGSLGHKALDAHNACFEAEAYKLIMRCRNVVAHGMLLGKTDDGRIAFEIQETQTAEDQHVTVSVAAYQPTAFKAWATEAERFIPFIEERLGLTAQRRARLAQPLSPHAKTQRRGNQAVKS